MAPGGAGGRLRYSIVLRRLILSSVITRVGEIRKSFSVQYIQNRSDVFKAFLES